MLWHAGLCMEWTLAGVFAVSGFSIWRSGSTLAEFTHSVGQLTGLSGRRATAASWAVALLEPPVAVLAVVPGTAAAAMVLATVLLLAFTAVLAAALRRGTETGCHCFGASTEPVSVRHIVRNLVLLALALTGPLLVGSGPSGGHGWRLSTALLCALVAVVTAGLIVLLDDLAALLRLPPPGSLGSGTASP